MVSLLKPVSVVQGMYLRLLEAYSSFSRSSSGRLFLGLNLLRRIWRLEGISFVFWLLLCSSGSVSSWPTSWGTPFYATAQDHCQDKQWGSWSWPDSSLCKKLPLTSVCCFGRHYNLHTFCLQYPLHFLWTCRTLLSLASYPVRMKDQSHRHYEGKKPRWHFFALLECMRPELSPHWIRTYCHTVFFLWRSQRLEAIVFCFAWLCQRM